MATKTKKVPKNWVFLPVSTNDNYGAGDYAVAVVDITPEYAKELIKKVALVRKIRATGEKLYEMAYWDGSATYGKDEKELSVSDPHLCGSPTECDQLLVGADGVKWCAYIKHSDAPVEVRTDYVGLDWLLVRAAGKK